MNQIPKSKFRHYIPQPYPQNKSQKDYPIDNSKITKNYDNTKFFISRNFGKDITIIKKNNDQILHNNLTINANSNKNRINDNNINKSIYIKKHSSATSVNDVNNKGFKNSINNKNKLGGFVSRKNCYNNNNFSNYDMYKSNNIIQKNSKENNNNKNNSISYGPSNTNRPYTHNSLRNTNNNMISIRVSNNNKSIIKNNQADSNANVKQNKTNVIISYGEKRQKNNATNSNKDLINHIRVTTNKENMINSMNNKIIKYKNENKENTNLNQNEIKTEYKINIIQYENKERTRINNKSDVKRFIRLEKPKEKESEKEKNEIKYFDESKITNVQIPKDYINTIYYNLLQEENCSSMLELKQNKNFMIEQKEINAKMRSILIDWLIDVHFKFGFTDETLFLTVSIIDRYISVSQITRSNFQLLGITALMIACKHEEIDLPKIDDFIYITDHAYVKSEVLKMEYDILNKLNFSFLYPSPIKFFEYLSLHFNFDKKMHMLGKYLMESFLLDVKNFKYKPSIISCSCAYIVMKFFKLSNYYEAYNKKFYNIKDGEYSEGNVKECARDICFLVDNINKTNFKACIKKYSKIEQENVAILIMNN